jgi:hypothetical protein
MTRRKLLHQIPRPAQSADEIIVIYSIFFVNY